MSQSILQIYIYVFLSVCQRDKIVDLEGVVSRTAKSDESYNLRIKSLQEERDALAVSLLSHKEMVATLTQVGLHFIYLDNVSLPDGTIPLVSTEFI